MSGIAAENPDSPETPGDTAQPSAAERLASEFLSTEEFSQYMLNSKGEMFAVFRGMVAQVSQVTAFFNEGRDMLLTNLISYDDGGLVLDLGANADVNRRALEAPKLFCVTYLEKVKIQFILRGLRRVETKDGPAFLGALPDSVLRLQRREYYRLATPISRPLKCAITFPTESGAPRIVEAAIADISGGGIGVISLPPDLVLEPGFEFSCRIDLPEVGVVRSTIVVRSVFDAVTRSGAKSKRAGCEFIRLPGPMLTLIQRYIIKVERERKARESGMR